MKIEKKKVKIKKINEGIRFPFEGFIFSSYIFGEMVVNASYKHNPTNIFNFFVKFT